MLIQSYQFTNSILRESMLDEEHNYDTDPGCYSDHAYSSMSTVSMVDTDSTSSSEVAPSETVSRQPSELSDHGLPEPEEEYHGDVENEENFTDEIYLDTPSLMDVEPLLTPLRMVPNTPTSRFEKLAAQLPAPEILATIQRPDSLPHTRLGKRKGLIPRPLSIQKALTSPAYSTGPKVPKPLMSTDICLRKVPISSPKPSTSQALIPIKNQIVAKPSTIYPGKSVSMMRFKRSKTRRFFHPYAKEIGAIQALKEVASSPDEVAAKFASEALTVIGEELPYKLAQQVPCWTSNDVQYWVKKIGFEQYAEAFKENMVDGDLLLHLTENDLEHDLRITSGILRKRFMRELESLKIAADYSSVDDTQLDQFLMSLSPELSVYTYHMLSAGINRQLLPSLTEEMMQKACGITNPIHRLKLKNAFQDAKHIDDIEIAILRQQIDVFISYRRSTGNQLASLIKVLLQLRGYKVFIDVDKLYAGKFDSSLLKNIQAAKHFILVLTPNSLDRLFNDHNCDDWIHKELNCAFQYQKNVIPIFDQHFEFPASENDIPQDIRPITKYNGVRWVHDYQEACMDKVERFIKGELNRQPSLSQPAVSSTQTSRRTTQRWNAPSAAVRQPSTGSRCLSRLDAPPTPSFGCSIEKPRRKPYHTSVSTVTSNH